MQNRPKVELLAPAGSMEAMKAAFAAGADAVYIGGANFGARAFADNLSESELIEAIRYAHIRGKQLYLTINTLLKEEELEQQLYPYLKPYYEAGLDAVIVQDLGVFQAIRSWFYDLPIHASTQMGITGPQSASELKKLGATRVVLARELSLPEIASVHKKEKNLEIECFVHGALCYCYSGFCLFSSLAGGRSGNRGRCAQPCRMSYRGLDEKGHALPDQKDGYLLSPKELCTLDLLPELLEAGVYSLKIEGRMKKPEYAAGVTAIYRKYLDLYEEKGKKGYRVLEEDRKKLADLFQRVGFTDGYLKRHNCKEMITIQKPVFRTENEALNQFIREEYIQRECSRPVSMTISLYKGAPAYLELQCENQIAYAEGAIVEEAKNKPLIRETIEKQMRKMGGSAFSLTDLQIYMDEDIFLPVSAMNALRREAAQELSSMLCREYERKASDIKDTFSDTFTSAYTEKKVSFTALVTDPVQLSQLAKKEWISKIYVEGCVLSKMGDRLFEQTRGKKIILCLPHMFREGQKAGFVQLYENWKEKLDGLLVRNIEGLFWAKNQKAAGIESDYGLYTFQSKARSFLYEHGVQRDTLPLELNQKEIAKRGLCGSNVVIYGRAPMMITANCVKKTTGCCDRQESSHVILEDRMKNRFEIRTFCDNCYNVIYNFLPTSLHEYTKEFQRLAEDNIEFRLDFSVEDEGETGRVLAFYEMIRNGDSDVRPDFQFTRGHIRRGVE